MSQESRHSSAGSSVSGSQKAAVKLSDGAATHLRLGFSFKFAKVAENSVSESGRTKALCSWALPAILPLTPQHEITLLLDQCDGVCCCFEPLLRAHLIRADHHTAQF